MLGRLILLLIQIAGGWFASNALMSAIKFGEFRLFIFAIVAAIVVYVIGILAALVVKDVGSPSPATLTSALIFALIAAVAATWGPQIVPAINQVPERYLVLGGAILGYWLKK
jgi:uncharacterized membrane protein YoaK (UPF0700 family)